MSDSFVPTRHVLVEWLDAWSDNTNSYCPKEHEERCSGQPAKNEGAVLLENDKGILLSNHQVGDDNGDYLYSKGTFFIPRGMIVSVKELKLKGD
jgi:hypothetical protein